MEASKAGDIAKHKRAEQAQQVSELRFSELFATLPEYCYITSPEGNILDVNPAACEGLGYEKEELIGKSLFAIYAPELHAQMGDLFEKWKQFTAIIRDITEHMCADRALRESEERFRLVANTAPVMIWMSDVNQLCTFFNQPWLEFTGRTLETELGNGWVGVHSEDLKRCLGIYTKAFDQREPFQMEYRLRRHDGAYRWIFDHGVPRFNADGSFAGYIGSCIDTTERKLAEEALSTVAHKLIQAQEKERTRIARELHDDVNQRLGLLAASLESIKQKLPHSAAELKQEIGEVSKQVVDLGNDVQAMTRNLHSSKLDVLGLAAAAAAFCRELSEGQGVEIDFHSVSIPAQLPKDVSLNFYRVLQEALQNAIKHSCSRHFQVSLRGGTSEIELTVHDSGRGFELEEALKGQGLGLTSMKERLKLVGGQLSVDTNPQSGTTIQARVLLSSKMKSAGAAG